VAYTHLAAVYDALMADAPYSEWLDWAEAAWSRTGRPKSVIDLGCGTGNLAIPLAKRGYDVTGVDLSAEMLSIAYEKMKREQARVTWVEQDMRELALPQSDAVISFCDSLCYLLEESDVERTFQRVFAQLRPGGTFLFDVHSPYKIVQVFGNNTFTLTGDEINYIWQCFCDPERLEVEHQLTFFVQERADLFRRMEEVHVQRTYQPIQLAGWLREAGFENIVITGDFTWLPPTPGSERLFFSARRPLS
jgi:SAM-dependent methyltransferase